MRIPSWVSGASLLLGCLSAACGSPTTTAVAPESVSAIETAPVESGPALNPTALITVSETDPSVTFSLINADTDQVIPGYETLSGSVYINVLMLPTPNFSLRANVSSNPAQVAFDVNDISNYRVEGAAPYAIAGDRSGNYSAWNPGLGVYAISATAYSSNNQVQESGSLQLTLADQDPETVTTFSLVNADTNTVIPDFSELTGTVTIPLDQLPTDNLNIVAESDGDLSQMVFGLNGQASYRTERAAPYALFGDRRGNFSAWTPEAGEYLITATPYIDGQAGTPAEFALIITDPVEEPEAPTLSLINADTNTVIPGYDTLTGQVVIPLEQLPTLNLNIAANLDADLSQIVFSFNGQDSFRTERAAPYALFGDRSGNFSPWTPDAGEYSVTATPYYPDGSVGASSQVSLTFEAPVEVTGFTLVDAAADQAIATYTPLKNGEVLDLAELPSKKLNILANTTSAVKTVIFDYNLNSEIVVSDSSAPYAAFGDDEGDFSEWEPEEGEHVLVATPLNGEGEAGDPITVNFTIIDSSNPEAIPLYYSGFEAGFPSFEWTGSFGLPNFSPDGVTIPAVDPVYGSTDAAWAIVGTETNAFGSRVSPFEGSSMYKGWIHRNVNSSQNNGAFPLVHTDEVLSEYPNGFPAPLLNRFCVYADWDTSQSKSSDWMHFATWSNVYDPNWQPVTLSVKGNRRLEMGHINFDHVVDANANKFPLDEWVCFTVYIDYSQPDGLYVVWMNGVRVMEGSGRRAAIPGDEVTRVHWGLYTNPDFPVGAVQYNDNLQMWTLTKPLTDFSEEPESPFGL